MLSEHVDFQINAYCTVVQPRSDECDFLEICAVLSDQFDPDRTVVDPKTGVMKGFIDGHLVLVMPIGAPSSPCSASHGRPVISPLPLKEKVPAKT